MRHSVRVLIAGVAMLIVGIFTDIIGAKYQLLFLLVISLGLAIAGALVAMRGLLEFLGERFSSRASRRPNDQTGPP